MKSSLKGCGAVTAQFNDVDKDALPAPKEENISQVESHVNDEDAMQIIKETNNK